jgi:hypothetical protein
MERGTQRMLQIWIETIERRVSGGNRLLAYRIHKGKNQMSDSRTNV